MTLDKAARGTLFLVAGPSGAGKDTLIAEAARALSMSHIFPQRVITRPAGADAEQHAHHSAEVFADAEAKGAFALSWSAHGLRYGIPVSILEDLAAGRHVVVNVSREVAAAARERFQPSHVIVVTASRETLARRLSTRGREAAGDVAQRLDRRVDLAPDTLIVNEGPLEAAITRFIEVLKG